MEKSRKVSKVSLLLTICFLLVIATLCVGTVATRGYSLMESLKAYKAKKYLTTDTPNFFDDVTSRVRSLDNALTECLFAANEMGYISATFQYALGKDLVNIGSAAMLRTEDGYLHDMAEEFDPTSAADELSRLQTLLGDIPMLYLYEHSLVIGDTDEGIIPEGYRQLDYSFRNADAIVQAMEEKGIDVLDSRTILAESGYAKDDLMMRTDHHWSTLGNLVVAQSVAETLSEMSGVQLDTSLLDVSNFQTETHESILLGERGQRIGPWNTPLDDVTLYYPTYDTYITRYTHVSDYDEDESAEGRFEESIIRRKALENGIWNYSTTANGAYGFTEALDIYHNEAAPDLTILVIKDSYSGQVASFLSLVAKDVYVVDLRKCSHDAMYYVHEYNPDIVFVGFCQQMLINHQFTLLDS